jgi:hypothetical protein
MHRLLERLDGAASTIVPLLYLLGLMLGTMAYFTGVHIGFGLAVGTALAFAAEMHSFLALRRVRAIWGQVNRTPESDLRREELVGQLRANVVILGLLIAFSTYNSVAFVSETFHPAPGFLPAPAQIAIRGSVVPALFLLASFLSPLSADASVLLKSASHAMLHRTIRRALKQWNQRIDRAWQSGHDLAPIAVALMNDAGDTDGARRITLIAEGLDEVEGKHAPAQIPASVVVEEAAPLSRPPTGPGTPRKASASKRSRPGTERLHPVRIVGSAEERIRALVARYPTISVRTLAKRAGVSESTASKHLAIIKAETTRAPEVAEQVAQ